MEYNYLSGLNHLLLRKILLKIVMFMLDVGLREKFARVEPFNHI